MTNRPKNLKSYWILTGGKNVWTEIVKIIIWVHTKSKWLKWKCNVLHIYELTSTQMVLGNKNPNNKNWRGCCQCTDDKIKDENCIGSCWPKSPCTIINWNVECRSKEIFPRNYFQKKSKLPPTILDNPYMRTILVYVKRKTPFTL